MLQSGTILHGIGQSLQLQALLCKACRAAEAMCTLGQGSNSGESVNTAQGRSTLSCPFKYTRDMQDPSTDGWVAANAERLRALPLVAGASGIIGVLLNRLLSGVSLP